MTSLPLEPTAAELCFDDFRKEFPHWKVYVEGNRMCFRYMHKKALEAGETFARFLIEKHNYPLEVSTEIEKVHSLPMLLILTYKKHEDNKTVIGD